MEGGSQMLLWGAGRGEAPWPFRQPGHHSGEEQGLDSDSDSQTTCWVILGKLLSFPEALIPHLKRGQSNSSSPRSSVTIQRSYVLEAPGMVPGT